MLKSTTKVNNEEDDNMKSTKSTKKNENGENEKEENTKNTKSTNKNENEEKKKEEIKINKKDDGENKKEENKINNTEEIKNTKTNEINVLPLSDKSKIIELFKLNIKGKTPDVTNNNKKHCGKEGHWLEKQMGIEHNANNMPDIYGYEMKKQSKKITFGDFSASEYIYSKERKYINEKNKWIKPEENYEITRIDFFHYFGSKNAEKHNRLSWSGKCIPKYNQWNNQGQTLLINENNDICIYYSYSKDNRDKIDKDYKPIPKFLQKNDILIAYWSNIKMKKHIEDKFNNNGFFICKKTDNIYDKICFGKKFDYKLFVENFKSGDIFFDSGMYNGNTRNYSQFRANEDFWNKLIIEEYS